MRGVECKSADGRHSAKCDPLTKPTSVQQCSAGVSCDGGGKIILGSSGPSVSSVLNLTQIIKTLNSIYINSKKRIYVESCILYYIFITPINKTKNKKIYKNILFLSPSYSPTTAISTRTKKRMMMIRQMLKTLMMMVMNLMMLAIAMLGWLRIMMSPRHSMHIVRWVNYIKMNHSNQERNVSLAAAVMVIVRILIQIRMFHREIQGKGRSDLNMMWDSGILLVQRIMNLNASRTTSF